MDQRNDNPELTRAPTKSDLLRLAQALNGVGARYVIMGGMALLEHGLRRTTMDIDLLIDDSEQNVQKVCNVLSEVLSDGAASDVHAGDVKEFVVVRINDEITIDLMGKACGISFDEAESLIEKHMWDDVELPFASVELLWRTKQTHREKDALDRAFLAKLRR